MPVKIPDDLPAVEALTRENIFVMTHRRAHTQDIRPLRIVILNLMPEKEITETQLLRVIGNTPLQVDVVLLRMMSHQPKHTSAKHLDAFYQTFDQIRNQRFDGLVITGAPVEHMAFEEVHYWDELRMIMEWADRHVYSTFYICWAAQAGLFLRYGIGKYPLEKKCSGIFLHDLLDHSVPLVRGFDDQFWAPHSRHTEIRARDIVKTPDLTLLAVSREAGVYLVTSRDGKHVYVTGHGEYDADTLAREYERDIAGGMDATLPLHYYPDDDPHCAPSVTWRAHANLLFSNWLNYHVYQEVPYDLGRM